jgi:hypothetical protein
MKTKTLLLVAVAVFAALVGGFLYVALSGGGDDRRVGALATYATATTWHLQLNGANAGPLKGVAGCGVNAPVVDTAGGTKTTGPIRFEPCRLEFGTYMGASLHKWITDSIKGTAPPADLRLLQLDGNGVAVTNLELRNALLTRFALPALNGGSTDALTFSISVASDLIRRMAPGGKVSVPLAQKGVAATTANFVLTIPGVDASSVAAVAPWSVEIPLQASTLETKTAVGRPDLANLQVEVAQAGAADFDNLLQNSLVKGLGGKTTAKLELKNAAMTAVVFELDLAGVGIAGGDLAGSANNRRSYSFFVEGASPAFSTP